MGIEVPVDGVSTLVRAMDPRPPLAPPAANLRMKGESGLSALKSCFKGYDTTGLPRDTHE